MQHLTLADLRLGLRDLFERRAGALARLGAARVYDPLLRRQLDAIEKLPAGADLSAELDAADARHDGFASALWHLCEAYLAAPTTPPGLRAALARARAALAPSLEVTAASYADEARAALDRRTDLAPLAAELRAVPLAGGGSLLDWARGYLQAGEDLDALLAKRTDLPAAARADAVRVRAVTLGILSRFRAAVRDEVSASPALDASIEVDLFAQLDQLDAQRAAQPG